MKCHFLLLFELWLKTLFHMLGIHLLSTMPNTKIGCLLHLTFTNLDESKDLNVKLIKMFLLFWISIRKQLYCFGAVLCCQHWGFTSYQFFTSFPCTRNFTTSTLLDPLEWVTGSVVITPNDVQNLPSRRPSP